MAEEQVNEEVVAEEVTQAAQEEAAPVEESNTQPVEQAFVDSMLEQIDDEDVKSAGFWKNLEGKDANEVGKYIKELQSFVGKKTDVPGSDASDEEWTEFYTKMGRPESTEGYDFTFGDEFKELVGEESVDFFSNAVEGFKDHAFKLGASPAKAEEMVDWYLGMVAKEVTEANEAAAKADEEMDKELRKEWGDSYDGIMNGITSLLKANGMPEENLELALESGLLKDPALAVTLGKIASQFADDPEIGHHQTHTMAGLKDQLFEVDQQIKDMLTTTGKIPSHIQEKRLDLMRRLGDNL